MLQIRWNKDFLLSFIDSHIINYPTPINLNYMWSFGSTAGLCLVIQILSGIFLAMHYSPHIDLAFSSVEHIMSDGTSCNIITHFIFF
jgi:ubiquinol-cytochrome c reductase cytochrome b subunit